MRRYLLGVLGTIFAAMALSAVFSPAVAATATGTVNVQWHILPVINFTLTPNYYSGYGAVLATFGTQASPTHGPGAPATVDFGKTLAGDTYLYKYAAEINVTTNDANGFYVYGEAATELTNATDDSVYPISNALYYLPSGATSDSNTGFTPGLPFSQTAGAPGAACNSDSTTPPCTITYTAYPMPIVTSPTSSNTYYYDYQFKVPPTATTGDYYVWIVYTVVGA